MAKETRTIKVEVEIKYEYDTEHWGTKGMGIDYIDAVAKDLAIQPCKSEENGVRLLQVCNRDEQAWWLIHNKNK